MLVRKLLLLTTFFFAAPFTLVFAIVLLLSTIGKAPQNYYSLAGQKTVAYAALPTTQNIFSFDIVQNDARAERIRQFLAYFGSPLEPYANDIVETADTYGLDYRLITAIAMQESNLCKRIPQDSYNCWGFGIYGGKITRFSNYQEAITTVTRTLAQKYKQKGLVTPEQIMTMYTPSNDGSWAFSVNHFMDILQ